MIYYLSRTGNVKSIVGKLNLPSCELNNDTTAEEYFLLFTYTDGLGKVPNKVLDFMELNHSKCKGVIASGNVNFGESLFCKSADTINELFNVPIVRKIDLRGNNSDIEYIKNYYNNIFVGELN